MCLLACDCNMEGSIYPGCDPYTGECMCRPGVSSIFCDECAPGHDPDFPACEPCHTCFLLWEKNVTDITRITSAMLSLIPRPGAVPSDTRLLERVEELSNKLQNLVDMLGHGNELDAIENLLNQIRCRPNNYSDVLTLLIRPSIIQVNSLFSLLELI